MLNPDTHILLFALDGTLTATERKLLGAQPWGISGIVLWELAKLAQLGRIEPGACVAARPEYLQDVH